MQLCTDNQCLRVQINTGSCPVVQIQWICPEGRGFDTGRARFRVQYGISILRASNVRRAVEPFLIVVKCRGISGGSLRTNGHRVLFYIQMAIAYIFTYKLNYAKIMLVYAQLCQLCQYYANYALCSGHVIMPIPMLA